MTQNDQLPPQRLISPSGLVLIVSVTGTLIALILFCFQRLGDQKGGFVFMIGAALGIVIMVLVCFLTDKSARNHVEFIKRLENGFDRSSRSQIVITGSKKRFSLTGLEIIGEDGEAYFSKSFFSTTSIYRKEDPAHVLCSTMFLSDQGFVKDSNGQLLVRISLLQPRKWSIQNLRGDTIAYITRPRCGYLQIPLWQVLSNGQEIGCCYLRLNAGKGERVVSWGAGANHIFDKNMRLALAVYIAQSAITDRMWSRSGWF